MSSTRNRLTLVRTLCVCATVPVLTGCATTPAKRPPLVPGPYQTVKVVWELTTGRDYRGPVQSAAFDIERRTAYLATTGNLYEIRDKEARVIAERPAPGAQMLLAPGGGIYAWLTPEDGVQAPFIIHLMDISGKKLAELRLKDPPHGFGGLYLGHQGKLIVTVTPLDDWQGIHGRFQYTFWDEDGRILSKLIRPTREIGIVGAQGQSFLLLGEKEAVAYSERGRELWRLEGRYRKAALTMDGSLALLNPAPGEKIDRVYIRRGSDRPTVVKVPTPVHHLRIALDGTVAVVGGSDGRYFYLNPVDGRLEEGVPLPFDEPLFMSDIELIDRETLAVALLQRRGDPPQHTWARGGIVVINRDGKVVFRRGFPIREPFASRPAIDVTFNNRTFIGFTLDTTTLVNLER